MLTRPGLFWQMTGGDRLVSIGDESAEDAGRGERTARGREEAVVETAVPDMTRQMRNRRFPPG